MFHNMLVVVYNTLVRLVYGLPYRQKLCRPKVTKFWLGDENFGRRNFLPTKIFADENFCRRKFLPTKIFADETTGNVFSDKVSERGRNGGQAIDKINKRNKLHVLADRSAG